VVNNFTRVSPPAWFDSPDYAGFINNLDSGVPYVRGINFIGDQYQIRRELPWISDDNPGFGASFSDHSGEVIPGNTFDFAAIHGRAILNAGYSVHSSGVEAFSNGTVSYSSDYAVDLICGKQVTTPIGSGLKGCKYSVFPKALRKALIEYSTAGGNIIVSGSNIGTDVWDKVFPIQKDSTESAETQAFVETVLGYRWAGNYASRVGTIRPVRNNLLRLKGKLVTWEFWKDRNPYVYSVDTPDGITPAAESAVTFMRYGDTEMPAGVVYDAGTYKVVSLGFPIETMKNQGDIDILLANILYCLKGE